MLKDITFGQYYEGRSVIHKTDPRVKIILMILFIVFVFLAKNTFALIFAGVSRACGYAHFPRTAAALP